MGLFVRVDSSSHLVRWRDRESHTKTKMWVNALHEPLATDHPQSEHRALCGTTIVTSDSIVCVH